jgi:hypothetical protein
MKKLALLLLALTGSVQAATTIHVVPTTWKLESYSAQSVVIWYAGSNCGNGVLTLPSTATQIDHNRLYATVAAAKLANSKMFVIYDETSPSCAIISYGLQ